MSLKIKVNNRGAVEMFNNAKGTALRIGKQAGRAVAARYKQRLNETIRKMSPYSGKGHNTPKHISHNPQFFTQYRKKGSRAWQVSLKDNQLIDGIKINWLNDGHEINYRIGPDGKFAKKGEGTLIKTGRRTRPKRFMAHALRSFNRHGDLKEITAKYNQELEKKVGFSNVIIPKLM